MNRAAARLLAVVFADVSDSTRLYGTLGDDEAHRRIDRCLQSLRLVVAECSGRVIKAIGDALLCVFDTADDGITAASGMQSRLEAQRRIDAGMPSIRVGIAYGPVLEIENDVFGDTVNIAARVAALATSGRVSRRNGQWKHFPLCCARAAERSMPSR